MNELKKLRKYQEQIANLEYTINVLNWELKIVSPEKSIDEMIDLISYHEKKLFKLKTAVKYGELIESAIASDKFSDLSIQEQRCIKNIARHYEENKKIPSNFYLKYTKAKHKANTIWKKAKEDNDYSLFKPYLKEVINLTKKYYNYLNPASQNLYDVMLNKYETGITSEIIDKLFSDLKKELIPLIKKVANKNNRIYTQENTEEELIRAAKYLLEYIGFDFKRGTIGIYPHGFTEKMCADDIRIAFKHGNKPTDFVSTIIHEGGHGIFEQSMPFYLARYENACIDNLYALHESQSRFFENILGRNKNFWVPIYDQIKDILHLNISLNEFTNLLNNPQTSLIRTEADELTYCMHIIIRYEIERDLFAGKIEIDDLPNIWNLKTEEYLGIKVDKDSNGLMQDVHWSEGEFGYFPTYLLGSIYDGMFKEAIEDKLGDIDTILASGNIKEITKFLQENIYINGGAFTSLEIIEIICHKKLSVEPLIKYFKEKYDN